MVPRNTTTGWVLEEMVRPALNRAGYTYWTQENIGTRLGGSRHLVDVLVADMHSANTYVLISVKWQQVSGTAEQKVPFEAICLAEAIRTSEGRFRTAYLVLGGDGWRLRDFFVSGGLNRHLRYGEQVKIITLEAFIALINRGEL